MLNLVRTVGECQDLYRVFIGSEWMKFIIHQQEPRFRLGHRHDILLSSFGLWFLCIEPLTGDLSFYDGVQRTRHSGTGGRTSSETGNWQMKVVNFIGKCWFPNSDSEGGYAIRRTAQRDDSKPNRPLRSPGLGLTSALYGGREDYREFAIS